MKVRINIPWRKIKDKTSGIEMLEPDIDGYPEVLSMTDVTYDANAYHGKPNVWEVDLADGADLTNLKKKYTVL